MKKFIPLLCFALLFNSCARQGAYHEYIAHEEKKSPLVIKPQREEVIAIDAGHGGKDGGAQSRSLGYEEKSLALSTAKMVANYLRNMGYKVVMTRESDTFVPLEDRASIANNAKASIFVSIHYNHCPSEAIDGIEVYYFEGGALDRKNASKELGREVLSRIVKHTGASSRGIKKANFLVIKKTNMPAILVEGGFLSNPKEREKLKNASYLNYMAFSIAKGIDDYLTVSK